MYMNGPPEGGGDRKFRWPHMGPSQRVVTQWINDDDMSAFVFPFGHISSRKADVELDSDILHYSRVSNNCSAKTSSF